MSKIEVQTIDAPSGQNTVTIGDSNASTITLKSGATLTNFPNNKFSFHAYRASNQSISASTFTKVTFTNELFDPDAVFDLSNSRFKPTALGKYLICANINMSGGLDGSSDSMDMYIYQYDSSASGNVTRLQRSTGDLASGINGGITGSVVVDYTDLNDYFELACWQNGGSGRNIVGDSDGKNTFLCGFKLA
tara:strand:- start:543 stop:1115 length:573 start_codon:yes stop_codon:yes gene_type:complete